MNIRTAFVAAPLLIFAYGVIRIVDGFDGERGPGPAWTTGHLAFMAALVLFVPIFWELRRRLDRNALATTAVAVGVAGIACAFAQFAVDIAVGFTAADHAAMGPLFDQVKAVPGVSLAVYDAGPFLFYVAQFVLVTQLAVRRQARAWTPVLVFLDFTLPLIDRDLIPAGALLLLVSFVQLSRRGAATPRHALAHA
ncbi:hypothetical protein [Nonomuraea rhodomycinica]|uniref:Uncharacterized protein n=1 Tax=Nonomuraea rhodomycinica TaxID=1712872 RepID=A0A7Y6MCX9_9ACTN|nr:hypothetical protein [Nonomuraea rhodomycinica]NUW43262.1 hypothetical protein [Nonomuraea rhodomycinica]